MAEAGLYEEILFLSIFLGALWLAGQLFRFFKLSPIVGQVFVGILLGPNGLDFVPLFDGEEVIEELTIEEKSLKEALKLCQEDLGNLTELFNETQTSNETGTDPAFSRFLFSRRLAPEGEEKELENFLVILGELGATLLILETGLQVDFKILRKVGVHAFLDGFLGAFIPIILGVGLAAALQFDVFPEGLGMGAAMAPTSVGVALNLLREAHVLDSNFGQTIVTAAITDDLFALVTLAVLLDIAGGSINAKTFLLPIGGFLVFFIIADILAKKVAPRVFGPLLGRIKVKFGQKTRDYTHLAFIFILLAGYGYIGDLVGSFFIGAFLTGVTFAAVPRTQQVWVNHMTSINNWLLAIFFGATVAFAVPVEEMLNFDSFWKGVVFALGPGILGKVLSGLVLKSKWVVGWAMVGRGEFALLVAQTLRITIFDDNGKEFLSAEGFGIVLWGILITTFVAPIAFGILLASLLKKTKQLEAEKEDLPKKPNNLKSKLSVLPIAQKSSVARMRSVLGNQRKASPRSQWIVEVGSAYQPGLARDILTIFAEDDVHVLSFVSEGDLEATLMSFSILIPDPSDESLNHQNIKMHKSVLEMTSDKENKKGPNTGLKFGNQYFAFDIQKYLQRLEGRIQDCTNHGAEIKIERSELSNDQQQNGYDSRQLPSYLQSNRQEEEDDDKDSAVGSKNDEKDADEEGL